MSYKLSFLVYNSCVSILIECVKLSYLPVLAVSDEEGLFVVIVGAVC